MLALAFLAVHPPATESAAQGKGEAGKFELKPGDRIAIIGNTLADRMQHDGWLETYFHARFPRHDLAFRNLGFSGDEIGGFGSTPQFNRRHLENRIAYRIQELAYGGLKPETIRRLEILGEQYDSDNLTTRRIRHEARPVAGTRLVREYRGVEHTVTVLADGYEWECRPYRSLSAIAREITGTRWNGLVFWGLKRQGSAA